MTEKLSPSMAPDHVAIIMDGNRRWAQRHGLALLQGHQKVARELLVRLIDRAILRKVKYLTLWAFSTENWQRSKFEVDGLMHLFREAFQQNILQLHERGVRLRVIGDLDRFPEDIREGFKKWIEKTAQNTAITVTFALNYGGRDELVRAVNKVVTVSKGAAAVTQEMLSAALDTAGLPDPDLMIRPGGEQRLSGFLPWQSTYAELYFTQTLMPDFDEAAFDEALSEYERRARRFGT